MKKMMNAKMMKTLRKKVTPLFLAALMLLGTVVTVTPEASAYMYPCSNPASMSIKTYPQDANTRSIPAYGSSSLSGSKVGTVYGTDLITILGAEGDALRVSFPAGSRTKEGWIKASYVSPANLNGSHSLAMRAGGKIPVYRYETGSATIGSISRGDTVYLCYAGLDHESGRAQFIYPLSGGGWKMGWCSFADIGNNWFRACGGSQTINDGVYFVNVSSTHRMDGMGPNENVHVWEKLNVDQQKVRITHQGGGIYHIQFLHNGTYLDQQYATQDSSTLLAHPGNGGTNQDWYIADLGSGRYGFFNVCSGLGLDVYCYRTRSNDADILAYAYNGQAVTLEKLDGGSAARTGSIKTQQGALSISQVIKTAGVSTRQQKMADQALSMLGSTAYSGYCQRFVRVAFEKAGLTGSGSAASALDACNQWRVSTSMDDIPVGAAVYLRSKNTSSAGYKYGHVGVYVGNGYVVHAVSTVKKQTLSSMLDNYHYLGWGWQCGVDLR